MRGNILFSNNFLNRDSLRNKSGIVLTKKGPFQYEELFGNEDVPTEEQFITKNNIFVFNGLILSEHFDHLEIYRNDSLFKIPKPSSIGGIKAMAETLTIVFKHFFRVSLNYVDKNLLYDFLSKVTYREAIMKDENKVDTILNNLVDKDFNMSYYIDFEYYDDYMYIDDIKISYYLLKDIIRTGKLKLMLRWYLYYHKNCNI